MTDEIIDAEVVEFPKPFDPSCYRNATDIPEYALQLKDEMVWADKGDEWARMSPEEKNEMITNFVINEEGTYNRENGHFLCTECYIKAGMPSSPVGWKCP
jgi:hypothetical protein